MSHETTSSFSSIRGAEALTLDEGVCVTQETAEGTKEDCSSKLAGELCTVSCVSGYSNSVDLPKIFLCESNESLLHISGPENLTCVADVCSYVPNLDNSVWEIPSQRSLGSQMVWCQEHSLSANLSDVHLPRVSQSMERTRAVIVRMKEVAGFHG